MTSIRRQSIMLGVALCATLLAQSPQNSCSVEGQLVDAVTNSPVPKAFLTLFLYGKTNPGGNRRVTEQHTTASDSAGQFRFQNLPPGDYGLTWEARGYLRSDARQRAETNFTLATGQKRSGVVLRLTPAGAISGKIVDEDGDPLTGAHVRLWRVSYSSGEKRLSEVARSLPLGSDDRGVYRIAGVTPGKYYASAGPGDGPAWQLGDSRYAQSFYPGTTDPAAAALIDVGPGAELEKVNFKLSKIPTVHVGGRVMSPAKAGITLYPEGIVDNHLVTDSVLPDGRFDFDGVLPGAYHLFARIGEGEGVRRTYVYTRLSVGTDGVQGLNLSPSPGVRLTGRIRADGDGEINLSQARVLLAHVDSVPGVTYTEPIEKNRTFVSEEEIAPGRFRVRLVGPTPGFYLRTVLAEGRELPGRILDLTAGAPSQIELLLSPKVAGATGTVFFPDSDRPAPNVTVVLVPQQTDHKSDLFAYRKATTNESGKFLIRDIPPGDYKAFAWGDGPVIFENLYMDSDFLRSIEIKGTPVSLAENGQVDIKLTLLSDDSY